MTPPPSVFSETERARRRAISRRLGWALGAVAIVLYSIGFFIQR
jgi:hypothetical protein